MRSLNRLVWRALLAHPARTLSNAAAVALGTAVILAAGITSLGVLGMQPEENRLAGFIRVIGGTAQAAGLVVMAAAGFMILNAFAISVLHRRREIGLQRALGMTRRQMLLLLLRETLAIALLGTVLGVASGPLLAAGLLRLVAQYGVETSRGQSSVSNMLLAVGAGMVIPLLAVLVPARRAARLSPLVALRDPSTPAARSAQARLPGRVGLGIVLLLALYLVLAPPGEWTGYHPPWQWLMPLVLAIPWLIGLVLILPALIAGTAHVARRLLVRRWGAMGQLAAGNLGREPRRARLNVLTFAVGLGAVSALNGALYFNNHVLLDEMTRGMLEQTAWFVNPFDATSGLAQVDEFGDTTMGISPQVRAEVDRLAAGRAQVVETYMVYLPEIGSPIPGFPSWMIDPQALAHPGVYTLVEGDWETARPLMMGTPEQAGPFCALLVPSTIAAQHGAEIGSIIHIQGRDGIVPCTVAGIGYGGLAPMSIVNLGARDLLDSGLPFSLIVWPLPGTDVPALDADLRALADRMPGEVFISTADQQIASIIETSDQLQSIANGLMALAVVAAGLGVINTTAMNIAERRHELGLLRAAGATRGQVQAAVAGEAALLGLLGGLVGLLGGVGMTAIYCLSFGGIPFGLVDLDLWRGTAEALWPALVAGLIGVGVMPFLGAAAAWLPARAALRGSPVEVLYGRRSGRSGKGDTPPEPGGRPRLRVPFPVMLALRGLAQHPVRSGLSMLAVAMGVASTITADVTGEAILNAALHSDEARTMLSGVFDQFEQMLLAVGVGIALAVGFLVWNAFAMSVTQRRRQVGLLRALGMTRRDVMRVLVLEALATGGAGTAAGLIAGPLLGQGMIGLMRMLVGEVFVFEPGPAAPEMIAIACLLGMGISLLAMLLPARRAAQVPPLAALRPQPAPPSRTTRQVVRALPWLGLALGVTLFAYLSAAPPGKWISPPWDSLLTIGFVLLWLLALSLIAPGAVTAVSHGLRRPLSRLWGAAGRLAADNLRRDRGRVLLTILSLAVGLGLIVGMTGFMRYMFDELLLPGLTGAEQLGTWTVSEVDFYGGMAEYAGLEHLALSPETIAAVEQAVGSRAYMMHWRFAMIPELSFLGDTYFTFLLDPQETRQTGDIFFTFSEGDWDTALPLLAGAGNEDRCGVLIAPAVAARNGVGLGDTFTVTGASGPVRCTVAGIGAPYVGASIVGQAAIDRFDPGEPLVLLVWPRPGVDPVALRDDLVAAVERLPTGYVNPLDDMAEMQIQVMGALPDALNALLLLAILAAALGVINTTMLSLVERRPELGLLRAAGATRRQVLGMVSGEAALIGLLGGLLGIAAGAGMVLILAVTYGGNGWGRHDLDLWPAGWRSLRPALTNGLVGLLAAPPICALAAWLPARFAVRGTAVETMQPQRRRRFRGSIRARFMAGAALLLVAVLSGLIGIVARHERSFLVQQTQDALRMMVEAQAGLIEMALPPQAETIDLSMLQSGALDAAALLRFQALMDDMADQGLEALEVMDREGMVLLSLDPRQAGTRLYDSDLPQETTLRLPREEDAWRIEGVTPVHNRADRVVGAVRLVVDLAEIERFVRRTQNVLWLIGGAIAAGGLALSWALITPTARLAQQLAAGAQRVAQGELISVPHRPHALAWLTERTSLRVRLTAALVLVAILMVVVMEAIILPIEHRHMERILQGQLSGATAWMGQLLSTALDDQDIDLASGALPDSIAALGATGWLDLGKLQELGDRVQDRYAAYVALADNSGMVRFSDQASLVGTQVSVPAATEVGTEQWRDAEIWVACTPLQRGQGGEPIGALRIGVRRDVIETYLSESRTLFRLAGTIVALGSVLLAQAIGGAVTAPVRHLAAGVRRVGQGDLDVQFRVDTVDELATLARAFNQMVEGLREREWLRDMFGRFVSQEVAEAIRSGQVRLEGEHRVVSILFCDIRDFTQRSAHHSPAEMVALLNEYLPVVVTAAQRHGGTVNKFGGDSTLIIYGAPRRLEESAYQAVLTALDTCADLARLNVQLVERGEDPIRIGVGINTGVVLAGAVGPTARQEYTVIGDTVNLASRIEALNKVYPAHEVLISDQTYEALGSRRSEFAFDDLGEIDIRGKDEPVRVWAVSRRSSGGGMF